MKYCFRLFPVLFILLFSACSYKYTVSTSPGSAEILVDGEAYEHGSEYKSRRNFIHVQVNKEGYVPVNLHISAETRSGQNPTLLELEPLLFPVTVSSLYNCYPAGTLSGAEYTMLIDDVEVPAVYYTRTERKYVINAQTTAEGIRYSGSLNWGTHQITFRAGGYDDYSFPLIVSSATEITVRHPFRQPGTAPKLRPLGVYDCGFSPKQVDISPDSRYIYIALLSGKGFQVFDMDKKAVIAFLQPNPDSDREGFVEGLFIPAYSSYFVSQMSTGIIFEYDTSNLSSPVFRREIPVDGLWSKVIAWSARDEILAVSNWSSYNVSIIEYKSGKVIHKLPDLTEPRGLYFSSDGKSLYVSTYLGGKVFRYNTETWEQEAEFAVKYSALRHIRSSLDEKTLYISDMRYNKIYELAADTLKLVRTYEVSTNPNSIDVSNDGKYLYVSTRGKNNPVSYLKRGLEPGEINIIDLEKHELVSDFTAGTQPTGLDVSPDNSFFVVSNFQDHTIEIFAIEKTNPESNQ
ncbi:MAG: YncE family protein [Spirochaetales bacterium]|nr:YncE family protein [Spirochaetales bacterium]